MSETMFGAYREMPQRFNYRLCRANFSSFVHLSELQHNLNAGPK